MNLKIKVCGMRQPDNIRDVASCNPNYLGFIFYDKSKRFVGEELDAEVLKEINPSIKKVGVFVNHSTSYIESKVEKYGLSLLQLHGDESVEQCKELKSKGYAIVKVFQVDHNFDFKVTEPYKKYVDYFLFDTKSEGYGGTGKKFNWSIFDRYDNEVPLFLSGGLDMDSIGEIKKLNKLNIHALDINSKFEVEAGKKDVDLIKKFIKLVK
ncbi:MAG TPA: phosphoribosylanthranilate isomerase [Cytophagaceae bacterium]|jgi:phosphoribosylanthranilate isomerase|nr:phosphoribosylanthranilate isomerase [Cytophagaceae bacterium]